MPASDLSTRRIISAYLEEAEAPMFLSGFFQSPPQNFHDTEMVELDIQRDDEDVAIVIQDLSTGARQNEAGKYTNKAFTPPIFDEEATINSFDLIKRDFGEDTYDNPNFQAKAVVRAFSIFRKLEKKIRRAIELQASQVLQTGTITLRDAAGVALYTLDFQPKSTHFVTVTTTWAADGQTGTPFNDIASLATVVRRDGRKEPKTLIMGSNAIARFMANKQVREQANIIGMQGLQSIVPTARGKGATQYGRFFIQGYWYDVWAYDATYKDPQTGALTPYLDPDKVIMLSDGRLDLSFGSIPRILPPDPRAAQFLPARISGGEQGIDLSVFAWFSPDGKHLKVSAGTRPLCIPTAIDTYGVLDMTA